MSARMWPRRKIIAAIQLWNDLYGEPPRAADWNPAMARRLRKTRSVESRTGLYVSGHWPSCATVQRAFDGSFAKAIREAGLKPHPTGPRRNRASVDVLRQAAEEGTVSPMQVVSRTKAVLDAFKVRDYEALRGGLTDLAAAAIAWRDQLDSSVPATGQLLGDREAA